MQQQYRRDANFILRNQVVTSSGDSLHGFRLLLVFTVSALLAGSVAISAAPSGSAYGNDGQVREGQINDAGIPERPEICGLPPRTKVKVQYKLDNGNWTEYEYPILRVGSSRCVDYHVQPYLLPEEFNYVSFRLVAPEQKVKPRKKKKKRIPIEETIGPTYGPYLDTRTPKSLKTPINDLAAFRDAYSSSVATIICQNPVLGGASQGSAVAVPVTLSGEAQQYGSTYLATAAHVVEKCNYASGSAAWRDVTVLYQGQSFPGRVWWGGYQHPHDIASIVTNAPIPTAQLALFEAPTVGDVALAIGTPSGVSGTVTEGLVAGANREAINLTTPSGPGASGGPVFNNRGQVIGLVIAGNGSLTVAQALPTFCNTVYSGDWQGCGAWPGL